jgi:hypothetical protein
VTKDETTKNLFTIIDRLLDLLMVQSASMALEDTSDDDPGMVDVVAGYALGEPSWGIEDKVVRDPELPNTDDPTEEE